MAQPCGPTGRSVLPTVVWDKLDSTPFGHCTAPDGSCVVRPVDEKLAALQRSRVHMDHYVYPDTNAVRRGRLLVLPLRMYALPFLTRLAACWREHSEN